MVMVSLFPQEAIQLDGEILFSLLQKVSPVAHKHLSRQKIDPLLYMTEWFMCAFARTLPWSSVLRVWDMFFCEGTRLSSGERSCPQPSPQGISVFRNSLKASCTHCLLPLTGVKIIFRVGLVLLKHALGSPEKLKACQGQYETIERLRSLSPKIMQEAFLVQEVRATPSSHHLEGSCAGPLLPRVGHWYQAQCPAVQHGAVELILLSE